MKCPSCQSDRLHRSRHHPEDGLWRSLFYTAYRCRDCRRRFQRLTSGLLLGFAVATLLCLTFGAGFLLGRAADLARPPLEHDTAGAPPSGTVDDDASAEPSFAGDLALVAAAESGDPQAQLRLGMAYLKGGRGFETDAALASKWIKQAAQQEHADAQYALGAMHHAGRGALQSFPLALEWFEKAAWQNHAEAQYSLGVMYRTGQAVAIDRSKAYVWFNLSAAQGHERAREARDSILPALTPEQVLAAQRAAQEWRPAKAAR